MKNKGNNKARLFFTGILSFHLPLPISFLFAGIFCSFSIFSVNSDIGKYLPDFLIITIYFLSFISIICLAINIRHISPIRSIKSILLNLSEKTEFTSKLYHDYSHRILTGAKLSLVFNVLVAIGKLLTGLFYSSFFIIILSMYYIVLSFIKFIFVSSGQKQNKTGDTQQAILMDWETYRICGFSMLLLTLVLQGIIIGNLYEKPNGSYNLNIVIIMAIYDFYNIISGIIVMVSRRKKNTPTTNSIKWISLDSALVSLLSLETAMFSLTSKGTSTSHGLITIATGSVISLFLILTGLIIIYQANKKISIIKGMVKSDSNNCC